MGSSESGWRPFAEAGDEKKERVEVTAGIGRRAADWRVAGVRREGRAAYRRNLGAERENMVNCGRCWSMQIEEELGAAGCGEAYIIGLWFTAFLVGSCGH